MEIPLVSTKNFENNLGALNTLASIKGTVKKQNVIYQSRVFVYSLNDNSTRSVMSNIDGTYEFFGLAKGRHYVVYARDKLADFNAVIQDRVFAK